MKIARGRLIGVILACMGLLLGLVGAQLMAVRGMFAASRPEVEAGGRRVVAGVAGHRLAGRVYGSTPAATPSPLVVVLHGDAPFVNPGYQYTFASQLSHALAGIPVVALLRPGYRDPYGAKSDGDRGFASGENYDAQAVDDVAAAIRSLRRTWNAGAVTVVGHSGGAAVAADVAALNPGLAQQVVLVGCPCDVPAFRRHMASLQWSPLWLLPVRSLSPMQTLDRMQQSTALLAITGSEDPIALPRYAQRYVARAKERGLAASVIELQGKGHEILDDPAVLDAIASVVRKR